MTPMMTIHEELEFTAINLEFLAAELMAGCLLGSTVICCLLYLVYGTQQVGTHAIMHLILGSATS
jgi:hypothetical protein